MAVIGPPAFERLLTDLDGETFAAFVSDVWAARGTDARVEGSDVVVSDAGERAERALATIHWRSRLALRLGLRTGTLDVTEGDVLVTNRDDPRLKAFAAAEGMGYVGPERLRNVALYAIDRERCEALFRSYFDRSVYSTEGERADTDSPGLLARSRAIGSGGDGSTAPSTRSTDVLVLAIVLGAFVSIALVGAPILGSSADGTSSVPGQTVDVTGDGTYPPPIAAADESRLSPLIETHRDTLNETSFRLTETHSHSRGTIVTAGTWHQSSQSWIVGREDRYSLTVDGALAPATIGANPRPVTFHAVGNGSGCMARGDWNATGLPPGGPCAILSDGDVHATAATMTATYARRYLNGTNPVVSPLDTGSEGAYRIESTRPSRSFTVRPRNYSAVGIVDSRGVIRELRVTYESPRVPGAERVTFSYTIENTTAVPGPEFGGGS